MKCFIVAFKNNNLISFLSNKDENLAAVKSMCSNKGIIDEPSDFICFKEGVPEPAALESYYSKDGKVRFDKHKFFKIKFEEVDLRIVHMLLDNNSKAIESYRREGDSSFESLLEANAKYLSSLTYEDIYKNAEKTNVFFNIVGFRVTDPGSGYEKPAKMTVSPPENKNNKKIKELFGGGGKNVEFSLVFRDNILKSINVDSWGAGYVDPPIINFSDPDKEWGKKPSVDVIMLNVVN